MAFNKANKVGYKELNPALQTLIDSKASEADFLAHVAENEQEFATIEALLNGTRITIGATAPSNPQNNKEIWFDSNSGKFIFKAYVNGVWSATAGVYK